MGDTLFQWVQIRNCRRFFKRYYTVNFLADDDLLEQLSVLGLVEAYDFSKYAVQALETFNIKMENEVDISGAIGSAEIQVTIVKTCPQVLQNFEAILSKWSKQQMQRMAW